MAGNYFFETGSFRFTLTELQLLRSRYAFRRVSCEHIRRLEVKKGTTVKRPPLVALFGIFLTALGISTGYPSVGTIYLMIDGWYVQWEISEMLELVGMATFVSILLIIMGIWALILAFVPVPMMKLELHDGEILKLTLKEILKAGQLSVFVRFLRETFKPMHLKISIATEKASQASKSGA